MPELLVILFLPAVVALMAVTFVISMSTLGEAPHVDSQARLSSQSPVGGGEELG